MTEKTPFETLCEDQNVPVIMVDARGVVTHVNTAFEQEYKWERDALVGQLVTAIMPDKYKDSHNLGFSRFMATRKSTILDQNLMLELLRGDGTVVAAQHYITAAEVDGKRVLAARIGRRSGRPEER